VVEASGRREVSMRSVGIRMAKARLSELARAAANGEATLLTDYGKPIAVISSVEQTTKAESGSDAGEFRKVRFNQFRGLPANAGLSDVDNGSLPRTPINADKVRIATAAEQALAEGLQVESDGDRKPPPARSIALVKSGPVQSEPAA
jgi:antitoxin (DNA-binding transcriptional repressor) of toxin-antitoxin stability system